VFIIFLFLSSQLICASRDFQFKVKGISMSVFNEEDVLNLSAMGNVAFNEKYMAGYNAHEPVPNGSDVAKLKEFIRAKYLDKKWFRGGGGGGGGGGFAAFDGQHQHQSTDGRDGLGAAGRRASFNNGRRSVKKIL
jgi:hypothetical protein